MPPRIDANSSLQRNSYFDFLRGIAIVMVVGIHTCGHHCGFETVLSVGNTILRQLLNVAVPLFFAISGFFLGSKRLETKEEIMAFYKHQIPKVYIPALVWGLPWLLWGLRIGEHPAMQLCLWVICGFGVLYFVAVIIQFYIILPVLQKITPPYWLSARR